MKTKWLLFLFVTCWLGGCATEKTTSSSSKASTLKLEFLIAFKSNASDSDITNVLLKFGNGVQRAGKPKGWFRVKITNGMNFKDAIDLAKNDPSVDWASKIFGGSHPAPGKVIVEFKANVSDADIKNIVGGIGKIEEQFPAPKLIASNRKKQDVISEQASRDAEILSNIKTFMVKITNGMTVQQAIDELKKIQMFCMLEEIPSSTMTV